MSSNRRPFFRADFKRAATLEQRAAKLGQCAAKLGQRAAKLGIKGERAKRKFTRQSIFCAKT